MATPSTEARGTTPSSARAANDVLKGGEGDDSLDGGEGNLDTVNFAGAPGSVTVNLATGTATG